MIAQAFAWQCRIAFGVHYSSPDNALARFDEI
jgi:hypothetical protein